MNWLLLSLICVLGWGLADIFYKLSAKEDDPYSHLKTAVWVGLVMGITSIILLPFSESGVVGTGFFSALLAYSPASLSYILSMVIGYAGLRYLELSIISPIQNASGAFTLLALAAFYLMTGQTAALGETFGPLEILGTVLIIAGTLALAFVERRIDRETSLQHYTYGALALAFPILYCVFDTIGTAADGVILSGSAGSSLGEIDVLILYGATFFAAGLVCYLILWIKEGTPYRLFRKSEWPRALAAVCEEFGQIFYVFAMAEKPMLAAPVVASYCILSVLMSRLILKERLDKRQWCCILSVIIGIVLLGIGEGLAE